MRAVLDELAALDIDRIVIGGDIAWGPFPSETLELLRELDNATFIRGNADREIADLDEPSDVTRWCADQLGPDERAFLGGLDESVTLDIDGLGSVLFCHATPRSDEEIITPVTPDDEVIEALGPRTDDLIVCGHIHVQYERDVGGRRVVNAGSIGMPYEEAPGAYWALLGPDVEHRRTTYDFDAASGRVAESGFPDAEELAAEVSSPTPRAAAIEHFEGLRRRG